MHKGLASYGISFTNWNLSLAGFRECQLTAIKSHSRPSALRQAILRYGVHQVARKIPTPIPSERLVNGCMKSATFPSALETLHYKVK